MLKLYAIVRTDLVMTPAQVACQAGHAWKTVLYKCTLDNPALAAEYMGDDYGTSVLLACVREWRVTSLLATARCAGLFTAICLEKYEHFAREEVTAIGVGPCEAQDFLKRFQLWKT